MKSRRPIAFPGQLRRPTRKGTNRKSLPWDTAAFSSSRNRSVRAAGGASSGRAGRAIGRDLVGVRDDRERSNLSCGIDYGWM